MDVNVMRLRARPFVLTMLYAALLASVPIAVADRGEPNAGNPWPMGGHDLRNTRSQDAQTTLGTATAGKLHLKWQQTVHGDVSATPAVVDGAVYFPDWAGFLNKLDARTGAIIWQKRIDGYAGELPGAISRTSPAVVGNVLYIGGQDGHLMAIDTTSGDQRWNTLISEGPFPIITQSPVVFNGTVYVGAASSEEGVAANPAYPCCTFRGSFSAVDAVSGKILWTTYTVPVGYSGGAVWGSTPAIDPASKTVFITTGNNYSVPAAAKQCQLNGGTNCLSPDNHFDSIVALDLATGKIKWATGTLQFDDWNVACISGFTPGTGNCPSGAGPDFDFGAGPNLMALRDETGMRRLVVGAGQKSGVYWLLNADDGSIRWGTQVTPGSTLGGIEWGTATDGTRIYVAGSDQDRIAYEVEGQSVTIGSFAALDVATGRILWQKVDPFPSANALDIAPVSVTNGVMLASSMSGHMYAFNAATGALLWDYLGAGSSNAGPAIGKDGTLYWGNGYVRFGLGTPSTTFYAFSVSR